MDKSSGKANKITITNDKGRLSKEDIEKMVNDAEKFKNEDENQRERVLAKNNLEAYCFNIKSTIDDEKFKGKLDDSERQTVTSKCDETIRWLDGNQQAEKENMNTNRRNWKIFSTLLSKEFTQRLEASLEELVACLMVCLVACQVVLQALLLELLQVAKLAQLLKKLTKKLTFFVIFYKTKNL